MLSKTVPARALAYAILISLLVAVISGALISLSYSQRTLQNRNQNQERLLRNVDSGIALLLNNDAVELPLQTFDLWDKGNDTVQIQKRPWGIYSIITSQASIREKRWVDMAQKTALIGTPLQGNAQSALYLSEQNAPLYLCGNTQIKGNAFLPRAGLKKGKALGRYFTGDQLIGGKTSQSQRNIPRLPDAMMTYLNSQFSLSGNNNGSQDSIHVPFTQPTMVIRQEELYLSNINWSGNIILVADSSIYFDANCQVEGVLAFAPKIIFAPDFVGQVQAFATEFIEVGIGSQLTYPSVLGALKTNTIENKDMILVDSLANVGGLIFLEELESNHLKASVTLMPSSTIEGQVWVNGLLDAKGSILGNTTCEKFVLRTNAAINENYLLDARLDYTALSPYYLGATWGKEATQQAILQWLE